MSRIGRRRRIHAARKAAQVPEVVDFKALDYQQLKKAVKSAGLVPVSWKKADIVASLESQ